MASQKGATTDPSQQNLAADDGGVFVSGKLVITAVVALALLGAAFSWWFRYSSTRRAAQFWGPQNVLLIRDGANVQLLTVGPMGDDEPHVHDPDSLYLDHYHTLAGVVSVRDRRDATQAHGLVHLRNELLMDRSFQEDDGSIPPINDWKFGLEFRESEASPPLLILFSADGRRLLRHPPTVGSGLAEVAPSFADGLTTVFTEWQAEPR
jgi:hypothetical protein